MPFRSQAILAITALCAAPLASSAQVSVQSIYRSLSARTSLEALSDGVRMYDSDFSGNIAPGAWTDAIALNPITAGSFGDGSVAAECSQDSQVGSASFSAHLRAFTSAHSSGVCTADADASNVFEVQFSIPTRTLAVLHAEAQNLGANFTLVLGLVGQAPVFLSSISHDQVLTLLPGKYRYRVECGVNATCSALCNLHEEATWDGQIGLTPVACPADFNADGVVNDDDFVIFLAAYNDVVCPALPALCPADLTADDFVNDGDFSIFVVAYNDVLCP